MRLFKIIVDFLTLLVIVYFNYFPSEIKVSLNSNVCALCKYNSFKCVQDVFGFEREQKVIFKK